MFHHFADEPGLTRGTAYKRPMPLCKIVYVKQPGQAGWRWQGVAAHGAPQSSERTYELFYECVIAARASGFAPTPELKCS